MTDVTLARVVGVVGVGRMGLPICARLRGAGFDVVATDIRPPRRAEATAAGARWCEDAAGLARAADVIVSVLPGPTEVAAVIAELTGALTPGSTWIDISTASPAVARAIAAAAAPRHIRVLDAPVGGNPERAREGRLLAFAGGDAAVLEAARPLLGALADRIVHVGDHGAGYTAKLLANALWFGQAVATAEALALGRRAGIDPARLLAALGESAAASAFIERDAPALLGGDDLPAFPLARCCEQLASVLALGAELEVPLELAGAVAALHQAALERYGDVDGELLGARLVVERAGLTDVS